MRSCGDKRGIYNGENKTKENESTLIDITDPPILLIYYK